MKIRIVFLGVLLSTGTSVFAQSSPLRPVPNGIKVTPEGIHPTVDGVVIIPEGIHQLPNGIGQSWPLLPASFNIGRSWPLHPYLIPGGAIFPGENERPPSDAGASSAFIYANAQYERIKAAYGPANAPTYASVAPQTPGTAPDEIDALAVKFRGMREVRLAKARKEAAAIQMASSNPY